MERHHTILADQLLASLKSGEIEVINIDVITAAAEKYAKDNRIPCDEWFINSVTRSVVFKVG